MIAQTQEIQSKVIASQMASRLSGKLAHAPLGNVSIHIVIPCYNEEKRLSGEAFLGYLEAFEQLRFVFVDDGSTDGTLAMLEDLQRHNPGQIDILALPKNSGKADAVRQGLIMATQQGADLVGYWDADLATPLAAIRDFAEIALRYDEIDVVYGARMRLLGRRINRTLARRAVSRICSTLARVAVRLPVRDTQCGAKLLRNTPVLRASLEREFTAGWLFDVELFTRLSLQTQDQRKAFFEYPLVEWTEVAGSKITAMVIFKSGLKMLKLMLQSRLQAVPSAARRLSDSGPGGKLVT